MSPKQQQQQQPDQAAKNTAKAVAAHHRRHSHRRGGRRNRDGPTGQQNQSPQQDSSRSLPSGTSSNPSPFSMPTAILTTVSTSNAAHGRSSAAVSSAATSRLSSLTYMSAEQNEKPIKSPPPPLPAPPQRNHLLPPSAATSPETARQVAASAGAFDRLKGSPADNQQEDKPPDDVSILLLPVFSAMTRVTSHLFLTGVGGMTRANFRKHHIDFVVNITIEAPYWEDMETMRIPLEDDPSANILPYLDTAVDRIHESIVRRNAHVLVHCIAGVSRSATVVLAYLMKYKHMNLRESFNYCYKLRPVIRPNNGFMMQLINYEFQLSGETSVSMVETECQGTLVSVPHFFVTEHPRLVTLEMLRVRDRQRQAAMAADQADA